MTRDELQRYIFDHYSTEPDYPWPGAPNHAVFRHGGNRKWFAPVSYTHLDVYKRQAR